MVTVMDGPETGPFNIGNPTEFTMLELAKMVQEVVNPDVKIVYKENTADDPSRRKPDITKVTPTGILQSCLKVCIVLCPCQLSQTWSLNALMQLAQATCAFEACMVLSKVLLDCSGQ